MKLKVVRDYLTTDYTFGKLYVDNVYFCETLEDCDRHLENPTNDKVRGESAIPVGTYPLVIDMSVRFGRPMPHVLNVPRFEGIRIHSGNTSDDTEGCLLVGRVRGRDKLVDSRSAFMTLMARITEAMSRNETIEITYERAEV